MSATTQLRKGERVLRSGTRRAGEGRARKMRREARLGEFDWVWIAIHCKIACDHYKNAAARGRLRIARGDLVGNRLELQHLSAGRVVVLRWHTGLATAGAG